MHLVKKLLIGAAALFVVIQLVPVDRTNPPVTARLETPPAVDAVLRRSCYDCHSNETTWPWYSYIAPVKFLVAQDVRRGRELINFSTWNDDPEPIRVGNAELVWEEVEDGEMPMGVYTVMHPDAKLSDADKAVLREWSEGYEESLESAGGDEESAMSGGSDDDEDAEHGGADDDAAEDDDAR